MKKIIIPLLALLLIFIINSKIVYAADYASGMTEEQTQKFLQELTNRGFTMSNFNISGANLQTVLAMWVNGGKIFGYQRNNGYVYFYAGDMTLYDYGFAITNSNAAKVCYKYYSVNQWDGGLYQTPTQNTDVRDQARAIFSSESFDEFFREIDFTNAMYDSNIPVPNIKVEYTDLEVPSNDANHAEVPLYVYFNDINNDNYSNYYIDYRVQFRPLEDIYISVSRGDVTYSSAGVVDWIYTYDVVTNSDLVKLSDLVSPTYYINYKSVMSDLWYDCLTEEAPEEDLDFEYPESLTNQALINSYTNWYKSYRKYQCMYGNYMRIWVRYFYIDDNDNYVVGPWRVWESTSSQTNSWGSRLPGYYQPYTEAAGNLNTYTDTNADRIQSLPLNTGEITGANNPDLQVTINQNTPNYPDYPTAVSYNHDNVLVQFIQTAAALPDLFSGFSAFLASAFVFIPAGIWSIIAMGFLSSIVIMIVKVL